MKSPRKAETVYQPKCTEVLANGNVCGNTHLLSDSKCSVHWNQPIPAPDHTPTPWKVDRERMAITACQKLRDSTYQDRIVIKVDFDSRTLEENEANAAFIVRAVNAHAELVELVTDLLGWAESVDGKHVTEGLTRTGGTMFARARKALTRSTGKGD